MSRDTVEVFATPSLAGEAGRTGHRAAGVLLRLGATWSYRYEGLEHEARAREGGGHVIYALLHGRLLGLAYAWRGRGVRALVSRHHDGEILASGLGRLGYRVTRGSSRRGGAEALLSLLGDAEQADVAITPDGPRGPLGELSPGVLFLAQRSGRPILPVTSLARPGFSFGTWDRFLVPLPFARVIVRVGEPMWVAPESTAAEIEAQRQELKRRLLELSR